MNRSKTIISTLLFFLAIAAASADDTVRDRLFPRPEALEPAVGFWTRVYTQSETDGGFVHDKRHLDIVYEQLRFKAGSSPKAQRKTYRKAIERYRRALLSLAKGKRKGITTTEQNVLRLWGGRTSRKTFKSAAANLRFQRGQADKFRSGIARASTWRPYIVKTLHDAGLPTELAALPHVESSYDPAVRSHAGAAGLWQFMPSTGRRFLRVDHILDERLDPYRATEAAATLLGHNYSVLKSWPLAITAYNHGLAGMRRAAGRLKTSDIATIIARYKGRTFGFASRNFYPAFLAALDVSERPEKYLGDLHPSTREIPLRVETPAFLAADMLADTLDIPEERLRELNPVLQRSVWKGNKLVPEGYSLRLPADYPSGDAAERLRIAALAAGYASQRPDRFYKVRKGDTLSRIAGRHRVSVSDLMAMNHLRNRNRIRIGKRLRLPGSGEPRRLPVDTAVAMKQVAVTVDESNTYQVRKGDTLSALAVRFGVSESDLMAANGIQDHNLLRTRLTLTIPRGVSPAATEVEPGESGDAVGVRAAAGEDKREGVVEAIRIAHVEEESESDDSAGAAPVEPQPELSADPADYQVSASGIIEVQASETLGHYADWLGLKTSRLRKINGLRYKQPLNMGRRIRLDFSAVDRTRFEQARTEYHQLLQAAYFENHRITQTREHQVKSGDSLWLLATRRYDVPLWLLRQYNPDLDLSTVLPPGAVVLVPVVQRIESEYEDGIAAGTGPKAPVPSMALNLGHLDKIKIRALLVFSAVVPAVTPVT